VKNSFFGGENLGKDFFQSGHLFGCADGDSNPGGQAVAPEWANNDSLFLQGVKDGVSISDFDHDVVGGSWNEAEILLFEKSV
jgi:hypothetical protein